jgi:hypothetical protein
LPFKREKERWAEALAMEMEHGDQVAVLIAEAVGLLVVEGDIAGVKRMRGIAVRLIQRRPDQGRIPS